MIIEVHYLTCRFKHSAIEQQILQLMHFLMHNQQEKKQAAEEQQLKTLQHD